MRCKGCGSGNSSGASCAAKNGDTIKPSSSEIKSRSSSHSQRLSAVINSQKRDVYPMTEASMFIVTLLTFVRYSLIKKNVNHFYHFAVWKHTFSFNVISFVQQNFSVYDTQLKSLCQDRKLFYKLAKLDKSIFITHQEVTMIWVDMGSD